MKSKEELRKMVKARFNEVVKSMNAALRGKKLDPIENVLFRLGRGQELPHWFHDLQHSGTLPNLDGKTIGSVIEMLLVAVLETGILKEEGIKLRINPARGVDLPDLDIGIKSPSKNFCTSHPFFSPYERLYGSDHDALVVITDYQHAKRQPPLRLQITQWSYLTAPEVADRNLCKIALRYRDRLINESEERAQKFFKFLAYVNQSDWLAKQLLKCFPGFENPEKVETVLKAAERDFNRRNQERLKESKLPLSADDLATLLKLRETTPIAMGIIESADNWVLKTFKEAARTPNTTEWTRLKTGPLAGRIGVSPALQWRYNFSSLFGHETAECQN